MTEYTGGCFCQLDAHYLYITNVTQKVVRLDVPDNTKKNCPQLYRGSSCSHETVSLNGTKKYKY